MCFLSLHTKAYKVLGYEMSIQNVPDINGQQADLYKIKLIVYADTTGVGLPNSISSAIKTNTNGTALSTNLLKTNPVEYINQFNGDCYPIQNSVTEYGIYESEALNLSNLNSVSGYYLLANICCVPALTNFFSNTPAGINVVLDLPAVGTTSTYRYNSSPVFNGLQLNRICLNRTSILDFSAVDADGDSLAYAFTEPLPTDATKPFSVRIYSPTYTLAKPFGANATASIDPKKGILNIIPDKIGSFLISVKVSEYRNGIKIGEVRRELTFIVENVCGVDEKPIIGMINHPGKSIHDTVLIGSNSKYVFEVSDAGTSNKQLFFTIKNSDGASNFNAVDTNTYQWVFKDANNKIIKTARKNPVFIQQGYIRAELLINAQATNVFDNKYSFKVMIADNACNVSNMDSFDFSITYGRKDEFIVDPQSVITNKNQNASMYVVSQHQDNISYQWQANYGNGFEDLINNSIHEGINTDTLRLKNIKRNQANLEYRCILFGRFNTDTSKTAFVKLIDSCVNVVYDTTFISIYDTIHVTQIDSMVYEMVDTLLLNYFTSIQNSVIDNTIELFPNPSSNIVFVKSSESNIIQVELFTIEGKSIRKVLLDKQSSFDVSDLQKGVYLVKMGDFYTRLVKL